MQVTLRAARYNKDLLLIDAAKALGISDVSLRKYEKGEALPNALIIIKMLNLYELKFENINFFPKETLLKSAEGKFKSRGPRKYHKK